MTSPLKSYESALLSDRCQPDDQQKKVILFLEALYQQLKKPEKKNWPADFLRNLCKNPKIIHPKNNLYLWGSVGSGKTWLMDLFFESLSNIFRKNTACHYQWRVHFHAFMQEIHAKLRQYEGQINPLKKIAKEYAKKNKLKIICLDEFFVSDIADAMILGNLFQALFDQHICIMTTSNNPPDELYQDGLQRRLFLKTIDLLKKNMTVLNLSHETDYRLISILPQETMHKEKIKKAAKIFHRLASGSIFYHTNILVNHRPVLSQAYAENIIWLDFKILCAIPRNAQDYLSIAQRWKIILLDNVSVIKEQDNNKLQCFIYLIDILYDLKIKLVLILNPGMKDFHAIYPYSEGGLAFQFQRTYSRLFQMQNWLDQEKIL